MEADTAVGTFGGTGFTLAALEAMAPVEADAYLCAAIATAREVITALRKSEQEATLLLLQRMRERGATVADGGAYEARIEMRRSYEYDLEALAGLQRWVDVDAYERAVARVESVKVNKAELNKLAKRGGEIRATIDAATRTVETPALVVEAKKSA